MNFISSNPVRTNPWISCHWTWWEQVHEFHIIGLGGNLMEKCVGWVYNSQSGPKLGDFINNCFGTCNAKKGWFFLIVSWGRKLEEGKIAQTLCNPWNEFFQMLYHHLPTTLYNLQINTEFCGQRVSFSNHSNPKSCLSESCLTFAPHKTPLSLHFETLVHILFSTATTTCLSSCQNQILQHTVVETCLEESQIPLTVTRILEVLQAPWSRPALV